METIDDFRDGTFAMDISEVGFYSDESQDNLNATPAAIPVMSNSTKSSFGRSVLAPVFKLVFSEKSRRRRGERKVSGMNENDPHSTTTNPITLAHNHPQLR